MIKWIQFLLLILPAALVASGNQPPTFTEDGFRVPQPGKELQFPRDHASHPDFKIEWWYITGHLHSDSGRRFGYQATFFRTALKQPANQSNSDFGTSQLYLTHMALTDVDNEQFLFEERLARGGWDAWSKTDRLDVTNGNWTLEASSEDVSEMLLQASVDSKASWSLSLHQSKPLIRFGEDGTSRKGPDPEARSYYLSFTRLRTEGSVTIDGQAIRVTGTSWMDHEIASNQLDPDYVGWDWIAIQLDDGWEVKAYLLRGSDGTPSPFSALIWIDPDGTTYHRERTDFTWGKNEFWESPTTGANYPVSPEISTVHPISKTPVVFKFIPLLEEQELTLPGTTYWEGAGRVLDADGKEIGSAYLELVGYAGEIEGLR